MEIQNQISKRVDNLEEQMNEVRNHISTTNEEMGKIKTNVDWLVKFFWVVATASIGGLIGTVINLMIQLTKLTK